MPLSNPISASSIIRLSMGLDSANFGPLFRIVERLGGRGVLVSVETVDCSEVRNQNEREDIK